MNHSSEGPRFPPLTTGRLLRPRRPSLAGTWARESFSRAVRMRGGSLTLAPLGARLELE